METGKYAASNFEAIFSLRLFLLLGHEIFMFSYLPPPTEKNLVKSSRESLSIFK